MGYGREGAWGALEVMQGLRGNPGTAVGWAEGSAWTRGWAASFCKMSSAGGAGDRWMRGRSEGLVGTA